MHTNGAVDDLEDDASGRSTDSSGMPSLVDEEEALARDIRDGRFDFGAYYFDYAAHQGHPIWVAGNFEDAYHRADGYGGIDREWTPEDEGFESDLRVVDQPGSAAGQQGRDDGPPSVLPAGFHGTQTDERARWESSHDGSDQQQRDAGTFSVPAALPGLRAFDGARLRFGHAASGRPVDMPGILGAMVHRTSRELEAIMYHLPLILHSGKGGPQHGGAAAESDVPVRVAADAQATVNLLSRTHVAEYELEGAAEFFPPYFGLIHQVDLEFIDGNHGYEHLLGSCRIFFAARDLFHEAALLLDTPPNRVPCGLWMEKWVVVPDGRVFMGRQYGTGEVWPIPQGDEQSYRAWVVAERNVITAKYGPNMFNRSMDATGVSGVFGD